MMAISFHQKQNTWCALYCFPFCPLPCSVPFQKMSSPASGSCLPATSILLPPAKFNWHSSFRSLTTLTLFFEIETTLPLNEGRLFLLFTSQSKLFFSNLWPPCLRYRHRAGCRGCSPGWRQNIAPVHLDLLIRVEPGKWVIVLLLMLPWAGPKPNTFLVDLPS